MINSDILVYTIIMSVQNEEKAIVLRREGLSYSDIAKRLKVSRASVCNWVKKVRLTAHEHEQLQKNIAAKIVRGRMMAQMTLRTRKVYKEKVSYEKAEKEFEKLSKDPFFMFGIGLWGFEKAQKNRLAFTYTAQTAESLVLMQKWIQKYLLIPHKSLKIRVFKGKTGETSSITVCKMAPVRELLAWQKLTMLYYS
jgi:predicted transcriptional regulator